VSLFSRAKRGDSELAARRLTAAPGPDAKESIVTFGVRLNYSGIRLNATKDKE